MMRTNFLAILAAAALAACGGKSKGDGTTPAGAGGGSAGTAAPDSAVDPDAPTDEVTTAEPALPEPAPPEPAPDPHVALMAAETAAYAQARPVFEKRCGGCHIKGGASATAKKLAHVDMTTYPFAGHHTDTITTTVRHVLGVDGAKPTMPKDKPGSVKGDELALITAWADAYDAAENGGAHEGDEHGDGDDHHH